MREVRRKRRRKGQVWEAHLNGANIPMGNEDRERWSMLRGRIKKEEENGQ